MRPTIRFCIYYFLGVAFWLNFSACSNPSPQLAALSTGAGYSEEPEEEVPLRMTTVSTSLSFEPQDFDRAELSETHVRELKVWWDSLPQPLKKQVQANQVSVQVVSSIRADSALSRDTKRADNQIEQTGAALEQVVGKEVKDMTYMVKTSPDKEELATTEISLVTTVSVKLSQFGLDMNLLATADLTDKNLQTLQYWWSNLPADLKDKIRSQEVLVQADLVQITAQEHSTANHLQNTQNQARLGLYTDILHQLIGTQRVGRMQLPLALVQTQTRQEPSSAQNQHFKDNLYLKIQLRTNKKSQPAVSL